MPRCAVRIIAISMLALVANACRESEPEALYNRDLGDGAERLLPAAGIVHRAHDPSINRGSTRADLYRLGDEAPPPQADTTATGGEMAELPPAEGVGDALGNVGKALLGNFLSGDGGGGTGVATAPTEMPSEETEGAPAASGDASDLAGVESVVADLNAAITARRFPNMAALCVSRQRATAGEMFELLDELNASVNSLIDANETSNSGSKARFESRIAEAGAPLVLSDLSASGAGAATGLLTHSGGQAVSVTFEREEEAWRIVHPFVPESSEWASMEGTLTDTIDRLDDLLVAAQGGSADQAEIESALESAIGALFQFGAQ